MLPAHSLASTLQATPRRRRRLRLALATSAAAVCLWDRAVWSGGSTSPDSFVSLHCAVCVYVVVMLV
jgi:hypothetical protein